jgi:hypothetical protein
MTDIRIVNWNVRILYRTGAWELFVVIVVKFILIYHDHRKLSNEGSHEKRYYLHSLAVEQELLQAGGKIPHSGIRQFIVSVWSKDDLPQHQEKLTVTLYKMGDKTDCSST